MTISKITRLFLSTGFTLSLGGSLALGCGSTQEAVSDATSPTSQLPEAPPQVVAALTDCANQGAARLTSTEYAILLDVIVTEDGNVHAVKIKSSLLGDPGIESCMRRSLLGTSLPAPVVGMRSSQPVSKGAVAPESRALLGNPLVLVIPAAAGVALAPIVLKALGITFLVGVTIYAASPYRDKPAIDEPVKKKPDCKQARAFCRKHCAEDQKLDWLEDAIEYQLCVRGCMSAAGC